MAMVGIVGAKRVEAGSLERWAAANAKTGVRVDFLCSDALP
jgi:hypothetical protein